LFDPALTAELTADFLAGFFFAHFVSTSSMRRI
jgi:hypothetical protein